MSLVMEKYGQTAAGMDANYSKFYRLAKEHFHLNVKNDYDYINGVKESIRFFSLDLPPEIKEIFIPYNDAPVFWIYESSLMNQLEEFMKFNMIKGSYLEIHKSIKENYSKWVTTKLKSEKDYYATLTMNFIERDINKHNIFKLIIKAIIYSYQSTFYNPVKAGEILSHALELLNTIRIAEPAKTELKYILNIYAGFVHLKENEMEKARNAFKEAIDVKPQGSTAKLYCALTELNLDNKEAVKYLLKEIFNYDLHRLTIALKTNNSGMFNYFFRNAFFYNIFHEKDFIKAYDMLESLLAEHAGVGTNGLELCKAKLDSLKQKNLNVYFDEEIDKSIQFFDKIIGAFAASKHTLLFGMEDEFSKKFDSLNEMIAGCIKAKFYQEVKDKVAAYDNSINDTALAEKHLQKELEKIKINSKEILEESISHIQENFEIELKILERKIDDLPTVDKYNPRVSLSNNMTYNIIIAFVVFIIGGIAGYSNKTVSDTSEFNSMFTYILISGSKWGAISFLVGAVISVILSAVILLERSDMRYKLLRKISHLKIEKDRLIADIKINSAQKEKMMTETMTASINNHQKHINDLLKQKEEEEKKLLAEADAKIKEITSELQGL